MKYKMNWSQIDEYEWFNITNLSNSTNNDLTTNEVN